MAQLTPAEAAEYLARWREVNRLEREALRAASPEQNLRQLCALFASQQAFPADPDRERLAAEVAERWARIRAYYHE